MNNTFELNRFWRYFKYDLRSAKNNYMLSLAVAALLPFMTFAVYEIFSKILSGAWAGPSDSLKHFVVFVAFATKILFFPSKAYGHLTEKNAGSNWLMIPASSFEKWLSLLIVTLVVLPLCLFAGLYVVEGICSLVFPGYGSVAVTDLVDINLDDELGLIPELHSILFTFLLWVENMLVFTLGAICFKRSKIAKTILCCMLFTLIAGLVVGLTVGNIDFAELQDLLGEAGFEEFERRMIWICRLLYWGFTAALLGAVYARIKTLKH